MLAYTTIERLPESVLYNRVSNSYIPACHKLVNENIIKDKIFKRQGNLLRISTIKNKQQSVVVVKSLREKKYFKAIKNSLPVTYTPVMGNKDNKFLVYRFLKEPNVIYTKSRVNVIKNEVFKPLLFNMDKNTLTFKMAKEDYPTDIYVKHIRKNKKHSIRVEQLQYKETFQPTMIDHRHGLANVSNELTFKMSEPAVYNNLQLLPRTLNKIQIGIAIPLTSNMEIKHSMKSVMVYIKDAGQGGGDTGGVGDLEMTLEVYKLTEMRFTMPKNYLKGLKQNSVAYAEGDTLIVHTKELGEILLYTDKGSIRIRTLPGMRINKRRLIGTDDIFRK